LFGSFMEPDTSIKNTRLLGGRFAVSSSLPLSPIKTRSWSVFHGH